MSSYKCLGVGLGIPGWTELGILVFEFRDILHVFLKPRVNNCKQHETKKEKNRKQKKADSVSE